MSTQSSPRDGSVAVFYDMEACPVPNIQEVSRNIYDALRDHQFNGIIKTFAAYYGNPPRFSQRKMEELGSSWFSHFPYVPKWLSFAHTILTDLFYFACDNPPPACIMLISSNDYFAHALHQLGMRGYTVILAIPSWVGVSSPLRDAGTFVWDWPSLSEISRSLTYPRVAKTNMSTQSSSQQNRNISILWDLESCPIPSNIPTEDAANNIKMALRDHKINGAIKMFSAYGDFTRFSQPIIDGLQRANVQCRDVPKGTNPAYTILTEMFLFALDNRRPQAYIMLISGDNKLLHSLYRLGMYCYTLILASPSVVDVPSYLRDAGKFVLDWPILSKTSRSLSSPKGLNDSPKEQKDSTGVQCVMSAPMIESRRKRLKRDVQGLLNRHSGEIEFDSFEDLYKDQFKEKLDYACYGLTDLEDLCEFLKDILVVGAVTPSGAKMIKAVNFYNLRKRKS